MCSNKYENGDECYKILSIFPLHFLFHSLKCISPSLTLGDEALLQTPLLISRSHTQHTVSPYSVPAHPPLQNRLAFLRHQTPQLHQFLYPPAKCFEANIIRHPRAFQHAIISLGCRCPAPLPPHQSSPASKPTASWATASWPSTSNWARISTTLGNPSTACLTRMSFLGAQ